MIRSPLPNASGPLYCVDLIDHILWFVRSMTYRINTDCLLLVTGFGLWTSSVLCVMIGEKKLKCDQKYKLKQGSQALLLMTVQLKSDFPSQNVIFQ